MALARFAELGHGERGPRPDWIGDSTGVRPVRRGARYDGFPRDVTFPIQEMKRTLLLLAVLAVAGCERSSKEGSEISGMDERIIFKNPSGRVLTLADLKDANGEVQYEVVGA